MALPNFFIVGAPKAGTTSLYRYLNEHPQVYMCPIKEPGYFAPEYGLQNILSIWEGYLALYRGVREETAIGEATVCYLLSRTAARNIAARIPHARIVISLRNPVDRAFSQYLEMLTVGATRKSFREEIEADLQCSARADGSLEYRWPPRPFLQFGRYHEQIRRYFEVFPRAQIHILYYEDLERAPQRVLAELFTFLGVDRGFLPDLSRRYNEPRVPRLVGPAYLLKKSGAWRYLRSFVPQPLSPRLRALLFRARGSLRMQTADRTFLTHYYSDDIRALALLLDRDLSSWLEPVTPSKQSGRHATHDRPPAGTVTAPSAPLDSAARSRRSRWR